MSSNRYLLTGAGGGSENVQTEVDMPSVQCPQEGRCPHQVLSHLLLRVHETALRHPPAKVPQVQCCFRSQRLP